MIFYWPPVFHECVTVPATLHYWFLHSGPELLADCGFPVVAGDVVPLDAVVVEVVQHRQALVPRHLDVVSEQTSFAPKNPPQNT